MNHRMTPYPIALREHGSEMLKHATVAVKGGHGKADEPQRVAEACRHAFGPGSLQWRDERWVYTKDVPAKG